LDHECDEDLLAGSFSEHRILRNVTVPRVKRTTGDNMGTFAASGKEVACLTIDGRLLFFVSGTGTQLWGTTGGRERIYATGPPPDGDKRRWGRTGSLR